ncbi:MAG: DUF4278 domain-containing protein [Cyanobacteria bacterium SID2]|nr:DUF4278 domain-containing protein [Cyanobacteria bacterium SID2]MBP0005672.1 DUF4278 domain-containing protein [Cyanobacteria bacterium SBC]
MKLCYRGISYDYNPPKVESTSSDLAGKYRGVDVRFRNPKKPLVLQPTLDLKYRGVAYRTNAAIPAEAERQTARPEPTPVPETVAPAPTFSLQQRMRELMFQNEVAIRKRQQTMLNRLTTEVGLHVDVDEYWRQFHRFVEPGDRATYAPSTAAVS